MALKKPEASEPTPKPVTTSPEVVAEKKTISPLWWIFGTVLSLVLLIFILGAVKEAMFALSYGPDRDGRNGHMYDRSFGRDGMRDSQRDSQSGSHLSGVITAIDGDTITVAGNGTTKQVKTTDTTEYYGAAQPAKVNDSVRIMGDASGDTFTATRVMISRQ